MEGDIAMKKLLILALALAMLLGLAAPALAYTTNVDTGVAGRYKIELSLIEYDSNGDIFSGMFKMKPNNRAYAKNEIVAAVAKVTVPKKADIQGDGYGNLQFKAKNMTFNVMENRRSGGGFNLMRTISSTYWLDTDTWASNSEFTTLDIALEDATTNRTPQLPISSSSKTYSWLVFAKITNDNAKLTFQSLKQVDFAAVAAGWANTGAFAAGQSNGTANSYMVLNDDYIVIKAGVNYFVFENAESNGAYKGAAHPRGELLFRIDIGRMGKTERLYLYTRDYNGPTYRVFVEPSRIELDFFAVGNTVRGMRDGDQVKPGSSTYKSLQKFYERHFEKGLGFSAYNQGNTMTDKDWVKIADNTNLSASVDLEPWVPYPTR